MQQTTDISKAATALARGELVAFATETVYGLGADAGNATAVARIFAAKQRPQFNPLIVHVVDIEAAMALGGFNPDAQVLAEAFWPGPLTLVVPKAAHCPITPLANSGGDSLAIRVPAHPVAQDLLEVFGGPVVAPSANPSGRISPTRPEHVIDELGDKVDVLLDGGPCKVGVESTIVSCLGPAPQILRHGGIAQEAIAAIVQLEKKSLEASSAQPVAPGQLTSHYAPRAAVRLDVETPQPDETYLGFGPFARADGYNLSEKGDIVEAAANLFDMLHLIDQRGAEKIAVAPIPNQGLGRAINDRLKRAAAPRPQAANNETDNETAD